MVFILTPKSLQALLPLPFVVYFCFLVFCESGVEFILSMAAGGKKLTSEMKEGQKRKRGRGKEEEEEKERKKPRTRTRSTYQLHQLLDLRRLDDEESSDDDYVDGQEDDSDVSSEEEIDSEDEIDEIAEAEEAEVGTAKENVEKRNNDIDTLLGMGFDRQVIEMILDVFHNDFDAALEQLISFQKTT